MNKIIKSPEKKFAELYEQMYKLCKDNKWGDPFSYARGKEIYSIEFVK